MLADIGREINATLFIFLFFGGKHGCAKMHSSIGFSVKISNLSTIADSFVFALPGGNSKEAPQTTPKGPLQNFEQGGGRGKLSNCCIALFGEIRRLF